MISNAADKSELQNRQFALIHGQKKVIDNFKKGSFSTVALAGSDGMYQQMDLQ